MNVPIHICSSIIDSLSILIQRSSVAINDARSREKPDDRSYKLVTEDRYIVLEGGYLEKAIDDESSRKARRRLERLNDVGSFRRAPGLITDHTLLRTGEKNSSVFQGRS